MVAMMAPREEMVIGCPGHWRAFTIVNGRYIRWRCTKTKCKHPRASEGVRTFHLADMFTGHIVGTEYDHNGRVTRMKEENDGVR